MKTLCERILSSDAILSFKRKIKIGDLLAMKKMQQQNFFWTFEFLYFVSFRHHKRVKWIFYWMRQKYRPQTFAKLGIQKESQ